MEFKHKSVLLEETIDGLRVKPDGTYGSEIMKKKTVEYGKYGYFFILPF